MPSIQDLLSTTQPDKLQEILQMAKASGQEANNIPMDDSVDHHYNQDHPEGPSDDQKENLRRALASPGPTPPEQNSSPLSPSPVSPEMLGMPTMPNSSSEPKHSIKMEDSDSGHSIEKEEIPEEDDSGSEDRNLSSSSSKLSMRGLMPAEPRSPELSPGVQGFTNNTVDKLKEVQGKANDQVNQANLLKAIDTINSGILGKSMHVAPPTVNTKFADDLTKQAGDKITQFKDLAEQEKNDPASDGSQKASQFAAQLLKQAGFDPNLVKGMSYNQIEKNFPQIAKIMDSKENREARMQLFHLKKEELKNTKEIARGDKLDKEFDSNVIKFNQNLDRPELSGARSAAGKNVLISQYADRINTLTNSKKGKYDELTNQQVYEIAKSLDAMLSLGTPTVSGTKNITPQSVQSIIAGYNQQLANKPVGAKLGKFVENISDTIQREKKLADKQLTDFYDVAKQGIPSRQYGARKDDYDKTIQARLNRIAASENPNAMATLGQVQQSASPASSGLPPGQEIISMGGKKYLVDHDSKKVIKEVTE